MTKMQHTPGPWRQETALSSDWYFIRYVNDANGDCVAHVRSGAKHNDPDVFTQAQALANARAIAEVPAMLEALNKVADWLAGCSSIETVREYVLPILARIDGEG